jgi:uncharacterized membrane protein YfhO
VFSESYYEHGWIAKVNGVEQPIYRVNYLLRGLEVPSGSGEIVFEFDPQVVKTGSKISLASSIIFIGIFCLGLVRLRRNIK